MYRVFSFSYIFCHCSLRFSAGFLLISCFDIASVSFAAIVSQPSLPLVLPPILFRHFQKFSKLLHPLGLHFPSIKSFSIGLQPVQVVMLLNPMLRRIPSIAFNKLNHFIVFCHPSFSLFHILKKSTRLSRYKFAIAILKDRVDSSIIHPQIRKHTTDNQPSYFLSQTMQIEAV